VRELERFAREAQALAALNHPNIVTIHDFGQAGGFYFLLMEFVDVTADTFDVGKRLRMRFRIKEKDVTRGYIRYFWKAAPVD